MRRTRKLWMVTGVLVVLLIFIIAGTIFYDNSRRKPEDEEAHLSSYLIEQDNIMNYMLADMNITPSGNAELDFLQGMLVHHQASIDMCQSYLTHGSSRKLKKLAREIIEEQTEEIAEMTTLTNHLPQTSSDPEAYETFMDDYNNLLNVQQHTSHPTTTQMTVEEAFAQGIIKHHQMALHLADSIYNLTNNREVKELAQDISENQTEEIRIMMAVQ